ncbi:hypothetical protein [Castellaniella sp.]|uniref:hypothetical protein n=1 Tax=Castellaniella sp. TaxID=1955812 RepID=UPI002AFF6C08|nr:hypothetical protein [Castellaniella sp.]
MGKQKEDDGPQISLEDQRRIAKGARQLAAYASFLRWSANFSRDEITTHPRHQQVKVLSGVQSGRFAFAVEGGLLLLGTQGFEAAWMADMPFDSAYVSDRLYLCVTGVSLMEVNFQPLALGIQISSPEKRLQLRQCRFVQPVQIEVENGAVAAVGGDYGPGFPIRQGDVIDGLLEAAKARVKAQDMSRFF